MSADDFKRKREAGSTACLRQNAIDSGRNLSKKTKQEFVPIFRYNEK